MTIEQMRALKVGDRVKRSDGIEGVVWSVGVNGFDTPVLGLMWEHGPYHWRFDAVNAKTLTLIPSPQPSPLSEEIGGEALKWTYKLKNAGNGFMVSDEKHGNLCDVFMTNDPKIAEGRANLISAAPELLAALRDAHKAACWGECEINLVDGQYVGHHRPSCLSRAALLKRFEGVGQVKS